MELTLQRITKDKNYTLGELSVDGEKFCHTLEPTWRKPEARKIPGKTAIPEGRYPIVIRYQGVYPRGGEYGKRRVIRFPSLGRAVEAEDCRRQGARGRSVDFD